MSGLYPTKTRLKLLGEVASSKVVWWPPSAGDAGWACWFSGEGGDRKVTARMDEMEKAGWVRKDSAAYAGHRASQPYVLTGVGHEILSKHREPSDG